jgi:uncharacterized coiled-coil protein SlyX
MEVPVTGKQAFLYCAIAALWAAGFVGCTTKDDSAVKALQEETTQLSDQLAEQNKELSGLADTLYACKEAKAKVKDRDVEIERLDETVEVPSLEGEATMTSLGALKDALNETIAKQEAALTKLKNKTERCAARLETVEAEAAGGEAAVKGAGKKGAGKKGARKKGGGKKGGAAEN